jgi:hypothetical protein
MLRLLDNIYRRFDQAWTVFKNPDFAHNEYLAGIDIGKVIARAEVNRTLASFSPDDFSNQHFKLGYYYAAETAKKVMQNDEDHSVGKEAWNL